MIEYKTGDILRENVEALVNSVNCVGVMGRGIALQFKNVFPENFKAYARACERQEVQPGKMFVFETGQLTPPRFIINFPTKRHWKGKSRMEDIDSGLLALADEIQRRHIRSIAIPPLGSGLGGLIWSEVLPRIELALQGIPNLKVVIYQPDSAHADARENHSRDVPKITPGRAALVALMDRYLGGLLDPFVSLLEVHKLMYFMQIDGEPLRLKFNKGPYGPYAENLRHVLNAIEGHLISGYGDGGDAPDKPLTLVPGALEDARTLLETLPDTRKHMQRVVELVEGFESSFGLELLATVHWVKSHSEPLHGDFLVNEVYAWNPGKRKFTHRQIALAETRLEKLGWLGSSECAEAQT